MWRRRERQVGPSAAGLLREVLGLCSAAVRRGLTQRLKRQQGTPGSSVEEERIKRGQSVCWVPFEEVLKATTEYFYRFY